VGPSIEELLEGSISEEEEQIRTQRNSMRRERGVRRERLVRGEAGGNKKEDRGQEIGNAARRRCNA
jgi:hypothetical protein